MGPSVSTGGVGSTRLRFAGRSDGLDATGVFSASSSSSSSLSLSLLDAAGMAAESELALDVAGPGLTTGVGAASLLDGLSRAN